MSDWSDLKMLIALGDHDTVRQTGDCCRGRLTSGSQQDPGRLKESQTSHYQ